MNLGGLAPWVAAAVTLGALARCTAAGRRRATRRVPSTVQGLGGSVATLPPSTEAWAELLDAIARHVRGGLSLPSAHRQAMASHPVAGRSVTPDAPFHAVVRGTSHDRDEATVIHALAVVHEFGGPVAAGLQSAVSVLRERAAVRADVAVHSAQARLSARVLTGVPIVFSSWGIVASRSFRAAIATPAGAVAVAAGIATNAIGAWWMRRTIAQVDR